MLLKSTKATSPVNLSAKTHPTNSEFLIPAPLDSQINQIPTLPVVSEHL